MPNIAPDSTQETAVAVGVIYNARGDVLVTRRHAHQHQGGLWEFPGGKIEPGEDVLDALRRELFEELGLVVDQARPLIEIPWRYEDRIVRLHTWRVTAWSAGPEYDFSLVSGIGREAQLWQWKAPDTLHAAEFPAANHPLLRAAQLPVRFLISGQAHDFDDWLGHVQRAYARGIRWLQIRWPQAWPEASRSEMQDRMTKIRALFPQNAEDPLRIFWNGEPEWVEHLPVDGFHLHRHALMTATKRPSCGWVSASCHSPEELQQAAALGLDFVWLSPVLPTPSHPQAHGLGWDTFTDWVRDAQLPVYALGGVAGSELEQAQAAGAQGVAAISAWWKVD